MDEMGISIIQKPWRISLSTGQEQVGAEIFWEAGKNVTAVCSVGSSGNYIPGSEYPRSCKRMVQMEPFILVSKTGGLLKNCSLSGFIPNNLPYLQRMSLC